MVEHIVGTGKALDIPSAIAGGKGNGAERHARTMHRKARGSVIVMRITRSVVARRMSFNPAKEICMQLPKEATVAVADGEKLILFRNTGDEANPKLTALPTADVENENAGSGARHVNSSANPDDSQVQEDGFAAGISDLLNKRVLDGKVANLIVIAAPRTLGELRKNYHQKLKAVLVGEIAKDLTGHAAHDIEKAIAAA
jgi:protein required for attachment to host cells